MKEKINKLDVQNVPNISLEQPDLDPNNTTKSELSDDKDKAHEEKTKIKKTIQIAVKGYTEVYDTKLSKIVYKISYPLNKILKLVNFQEKYNRTRDLGHSKLASVVGTAVAVAGNGAAKSVGALECVEAWFLPLTGVGTFAAPLLFAGGYYTFSQANNIEKSIQLSLPVLIDYSINQLNLLPYINAIETSFINMIGYRNLRIPKLIDSTKINHLTISYMKNKEGRNVIKNGNTLLISNSAYMPSQLICTINLHKDKNNAAIGRCVVKHENPHLNDVKSRGVLINPNTLVERIDARNETQIDYKEVYLTVLSNQMKSTNITQNETFSTANAENLRNHIGSHQNTLFSEASAGSHDHVDLYLTLNSQQVQHLESANSRMDRLQNHITVSSQSNSPSFESSNALISQFSSTNQMLNSLQNLNTTQKNFHQNLASTRNTDFSQFTNQSRQTYHFDTASEAARYTTFHSNYFNGDFRERPAPVNNYSFFSGWDPSGKDGWGKSGHCDSRFQNCSSFGGASDCRDSGSSKCESSLFK